MKTKQTSAKLYIEVDDELMKRKKGQSGSGELNKFTNQRTIIDVNNLRKYSSTYANEMQWKSN